MEVKQVAIIGAGTMGNGIAHVFGMNGYLVNLCDLDEKVLDKALDTIEKNLWRMVEKEKIDELSKSQTLEKIRPFTNIKDAVKQADLVVEAVSENLSLKLKLFKELDNYAPDDAILASNTSSLSITKIASATTKPDQVIGMHFMNPVPVMKLVEIIKGYSTSEIVVKTILETSKKLDKIPVLVQDYPGFISNRILMPMINEAIYALFERVAGVKEIDQVMKVGMAHPMGPLQLADFIGLDVCLSILQVLQEGFGQPKYSPCPLLIQMVTAGKLGKKTGEGFYVYEADSKELVVSGQFSGS